MTHCAVGSYTSVSIRAPAKVNLGLEIRGRRPDGFHEIGTLFQAISLHDRLRLIRRSRGIRVSCPQLPEMGRRNLAWRAAAVFFRESGLSGGLDIVLEKRIPVGGGLGGGSSDAAAVLLGACRLYGIRPTPEELARWAGSLGSDVPFFLTLGSAVGRGRGEIIEAVRGAPSAAVLVCLSAFGISTATVYRAYRADRLTTVEDRLTILLRRWRRGDLSSVGETLFNDLEETVFRLYPSLAAVKEKLLSLGARGALVSGSGSSIFGLFPSGGAALEAARVMRAEFPIRPKVVRFLPFRRRWGVVKR